MPVEHARSCIAHHLFYPGSHFRLVAVDSAPGAARFILPEGTFFQALQGVIQKFQAFGAQTGSLSVPAPAVYPDHGLYGLFLYIHSCIITRLISFFFENYIHVVFVSGQAPTLRRLIYNILLYFYD